MKKIISAFCFLISAFVLSAQDKPAPAAASVAEVQAGTVKNKFVSPYTLANGNPNTNALTPAQQAKLDAAVTNQFVLPFNTNNIIFPTNFMAANPAGTNQVIIMHSNGTTKTNTAASGSDADRGLNFMASIEDATLLAGDVLFLGPGKYAMSGVPLTVAYSALDLTGGGMIGRGIHLVGKGKNLTVIDLTGAVDASAYYGSYSSLRDLTITNVYYVTDTSMDAAATFATNQFAYHWNVEIDALSIDYFYSLTLPQNLWIENSLFRFSYDVFASLAINNTNVLVSRWNTYLGNGNNATPHVRVQYGSMARTCYVIGDTITVSGGTNSNIGLSAGESGATNSTVYVWDATINSSGISLSKGTFSTSKIFVGSGCKFDQLGAALDAAAISSKGFFGFTGIVTNWGTGVTSNRVYYSSGIVTNVTRP